MLWSKRGPLWEILYKETTSISTFDQNFPPGLLFFLTSPSPSPSPKSKPQIPKSQIKRGKGEFGLWAVSRILAQNAGGKSGAKLLVLC